MLGEELAKKEDRRFCSAVHLVVQDELYSPQVNRLKPKIKVKALTQHWQNQQNLGEEIQLL
jgi:hypothetical protein